MATIIKASDPRGVVAAAAFNFDDLTVQAGRYLEKTRAEAAKIIADAKAQAQREADAIRKRAAADGVEDARRAAAQAVETTLAAKALPALRQAAKEIQLEKQTLLKRWEANALRVAFALAERVIRGELSRRPEIPLKLVRESLELAVGSAKLRLLLHPAEYEAIAPQAAALAKELAPAAEVQIAADAALSPGGCRVETEFGTIDQQIESQLARLEEELA